MKSQELRKFYSELSKLNNAFTHYFFVWTQFTLDYTEDILNNPEEITENYFNGNPYSPKHSVRLKDLSNEHAKTNQTLLEGIFILILSHFEDYLKSMHEFAQQIDNTVIPLDQGDFEDDALVFDKILNRIGIKRAALAPEHYDTYDYLRLKRNRLIHKSSEKISKSIRELIAKKGKGLHSFWNKTLPSELQGIDFSNKDAIDNLEFNILIDTLNTLRGISAKIDEGVIQQLGETTVCKNEILPRFFNDTKVNPDRISEKKVQRMLAGYCRTEYGFSPDENMFKQILDDIA